MRAFKKILVVVLVFYAFALGALYKLMRQPALFGQVMRHVPGPAMFVIPFKPLWFAARAGNLRVGDSALIGLVLIALAAWSFSIWQTAGTWGRRVTAAVAIASVTATAAATISRREPSPGSLANLERASRAKSRWNVWP